jgi:hypothetical protein
VICTTPFILGKLSNDPPTKYKTRKASLITLIAINAP